MAKNDPSEIGKLTMATIGAGKIAKRAAAEEKEIVCARVFGIASGVKLKTMPNGDAFEAIVGSFEAHNADTGEILQSGVLYLPSGMHERIVEPLKNEPDSTIQFGIEISAFPASNPQGYSWKAKPIVKATAADPLASLREQAMAGFALLEAPKPPADKGEPAKKGSKK